MDSRILGIVGGVLLVIGVFCPVFHLDFLGQTANISYLGGLAGASWQGIILILLGLAGIALAVLRKYKLLLIPGILALLIYAIDFLTYKSKFTEGMGALGQSGPEVENAISLQWGWAVLVLGALALIAAGLMGRNAPAPVGYGSAPPPPPPYNPGR